MKGQELQSISPKQLETMSEKFIINCSACHGRLGKGDGPAAQAIYSKPIDFRKLPLRKGEKFTETETRRIIEDGIPGTLMVSFKYLRTEEMDLLAKYVMYLSKH